MSFAGPTDNCTCPDGYTLVPGSGGAAPTCQPADASWPPEVPKCAQSPSAAADAGVSGPALLIIGLGGLAIIAVLGR